jgi:hypothetical protein
MSRRLSPEFIAAANTCGITRRSLAQQTGINQVSLGRWLNGHPVADTLLANRTVTALARLLNVPITAVFDDPREIPHTPPTEREILRVPPELLLGIQQVCAARGMSMQQGVRDALAAFIADHAVRISRPAGPRESK